MPMKRASPTTNWNPIPYRVFSFFALGMVFALASCTPPAPLEPFADPARQGDIRKAQPIDPEAGYSYWDDHGGDGSLRVQIDLSEQTAYFFRGETQIGRSRVATGLARYRTPRGSFTIIEKKVNKRSNLYGVIEDASGNIIKDDADSRRDAIPPGGRFVGASMPNWMRLTRGGVGMHHGPIPHPGRPASHGCIRLPQHIAETLFANAPLGTPVKIVE